MAGVLEMEKRDTLAPKHYRKSFQERCEGESKGARSPSFIFVLPLGGRCQTQLGTRAWCLGGGVPCSVGDIQHQVQEQAGSCVPPAGTANQGCLCSFSGGKGGKSGHVGDELG